MKTEQIEQFLTLLDNVPSERDALSGWVKMVQASLGPMLAEIKLDMSDVVVPLAGYLAWKATGSTPEISHQKLISLFCRSNGLVQEILHRLTLSGADRASELRRVEEFELTNCLFNRDITSCVGDLKELGYSVLPTVISEEVVSGLESLAKNEHCILRDRFDGQSSDALVRVDPDSPLSTSAWVPEDRIVSSGLVEKILSDVQLRYVISTYLATTSFHARRPQLWWSFPSIDRLPKSESAQMFHFDLDAPKWVKFFIYLSDVNSDTGPHFFVPGTHKVGARSSELLHRGYVRISNDDLEKHHPGQSVSISGKKGTAFFGDTSCWHKGGELTQGSRIVFQLEFAATSFQENHGL
jgi:hypothetical protein